MTSNEYLEHVYNDVHLLLQDVCGFLTKVMESGTMSVEVQTQAQQLISRAQHKVDMMNTIEHKANNNGPYVEMNAGTTLDEYVITDQSNIYEEDVYEESYDQVGSLEVAPATQHSTLDCCPYNNMAANQLSEKAVKFGILYRKERYFTFLEQKKQLLVGLIGCWLLIYSGKKDLKPIQVLNISNYKAHAVDQKKDPIFEVISENKKSLEFIARSDKDKEQWIVAINLKKDFNVGKRDLPGLPTTNRESLTSQSTDNNERKTTPPGVIPSLSSLSNSGSEGDLYENLEDIQWNQKPNNDNIGKTPNLPPRQAHHFYHTNYEKNPPSQVAPVNELEQEEEEETYDTVQTSSQYSHEEQETLEIYDEPKINVSTPENHDEDEDCTYDLPMTETNDLQRISPVVMHDHDNNHRDEDDEDVEYDELKIDVPSIELKVENVSKLNDIINNKKLSGSSPKQRLQMTEAKNSKQQTLSTAECSGYRENKRINTIIQQLESTLVLRGAKQ